MPPSKSNESNEALGHNLELITDLTQSLILELKSFSVNHDNLKSQFEAVTDDVARLSSIIRDGNGKPSLITTIALLEKDLSNLKKEFEKLEKETEDSLDKLQVEFTRWKEEKDKEAAEEARGKWQLKVAIAGGALGTLTAIINVILQILAKK